MFLWWCGDSYVWHHKQTAVVKVEKSILTSVCAESSGKNIENNKRTVTLIQPGFINVCLLLLNVICTDIVFVLC